MKGNIIKNIKLIMTALLFCIPINASGGGGAAKASTQVAIEKIRTLNQWIHENNCGLHALNNAYSGLKLLNAKDDKEAGNIRKKMTDKKAFYEFTEKLGFSQKDTNIIKGVNLLEMESFIEKLNATDDILIIEAEYINPNGELTMLFLKNSFNALSALRNLSEAGENYRKGFVITNGGNHWISCALEKTNGSITRILSMNSAGYASDSNPFAHWAKKNLAPSYVGLTDEAAVGRVVDIANDTDLSEKLNLYNRYQRCLKIADSIFRSFSECGALYSYVTEGLFPDPKIIFSRDLIKEKIEKFTQIFADLVKEIGMRKIHLSEKKNDKNETIYLSKFEFLQMFLPDSPWWTDASFFSNQSGPLDFTAEQRAEMIELMDIETFLPEAEKEFNEQLLHQKCLKLQTL